MVWRRGSRPAAGGARLHRHRPGAAHGAPAALTMLDIGKTDISLLINEFAKPAAFAVTFHFRDEAADRERPLQMGESTMKSFLKSCTALALALQLRRPGGRAGCKEVGKGEGAGRHRRLARLHRARRDRQELRLGHRLREEDRLQGQRQDRRHLGRDGGADERGRLRPRHRLGRRLAAPDRRQARAADQHRPDPELEDRRPAPAERALAHGRRRRTTACPTSGARTC